MFVLHRLAGSTIFVAKKPPRSVFIWFCSHFFESVSDDVISCCRNGLGEQKFFVWMFCKHGVNVPVVRYIWLDSALASIVLVIFWENCPCFTISYCRGHLPGLSLVLSGSARGSLQDEDHSGSRLHLFPGLYHMRSETSPERFRSGLELAGSWERRQDGITRLICGFPSY